MGKTSWGASFRNVNDPLSVGDLNTHTHTQITTQMNKQIFQFFREGGPGKVTWHVIALMSELMIVI